MFLYCITPYSKLICNFIKVGICKDINQYIADKNMFKKYLKSMSYYDNPIKNKNYEINFKTNKIIINDLNIIKNKYIRCKNKIKILLLYEYIKMKKRIFKKTINYMINVPLHEDIIQKIVKINSNRHIIEYKILCDVIKKEVIYKYNNYFKCNPKISNNIKIYINYDRNKFCNKNEIMNIIIKLKNIIFILKNFMEIHFIVIYINQFYKCLKENMYQNDGFISIKKMINKTI